VRTSKGAAHRLLDQFRATVLGILGPDYSVHLKFKDVGKRVLFDHFMVCDRAAPEAIFRGNAVEVAAFIRGVGYAKAKGQL